MLVNAMRGLPTEFGLIVPKGIGRLGELAALVDQDETLPETARRVFTASLARCDALAETIERSKQRLSRTRGPTKPRVALATIPGIGPVTDH